MFIGKVLLTVLSRLYERRPLADFKLAVGPAYGSRMVANQFRADRDLILYSIKNLIVASKFSLH
jgi:hypothetical protein